MAELPRSMCNFLFRYSWHWGEMFCISSRSLLSVSIWKYRHSHRDACGICIEVCVCLVWKRSSCTWFSFCFVLNFSAINRNSCGGRLAHHKNNHWWKMFLLSNVRHGNGQIAKKERLYQDRTESIIEFWHIKSFLIQHSHFTFISNKEFVHDPNHSNNYETFHLPLILTGKMAVKQTLGLLNQHSTSTKVYEHCANTWSDCAKKSNNSKGILGIFGFNSSVSKVKLIQCASQKKGWGLKPNHNKCQVI